MMTYTRQHLDETVKIAQEHSEAFQAVVWHLLVSHPALKAHATKWESTQ